MECKELMRNILKISMLHKVMIRKRTADLGQYTGQWMPVISYVQEHDGCTQVQLANFLRVTPASVALSTKRLQKAGYLEKEVDEYNLRCNKLHITELGKKLLADCKDIFAQFDQESFAGFSQEELRTLADYLNRIAINMGGGRELNFGEILDLQHEKKEKQG